MQAKTYIFDTNIVSEMLRQRPRALIERIRQDQDNILILCDPVIYEVERGLEHKGATSQLQRFRQDIIPLFNIIGVQLADWRVASKLWASTRSEGKQLADVDLLLAAISVRLKGIVVTADGDFAHIPLIQTENWLKTQNGGDE